MLDLLADISTQPQTLLGNAPILEEAYSRLPELVKGCDRFVVTGMATSLWAWHAAGIVLQRAGRTCVITDASEYLRYGAASDDQVPILITSRSGESVEILHLLEAIQRDRCVVGITASSGSTLAKRSNFSMCFEAEEAAFYNTKSFTMTLAVAAAAAGGIAGRSDLAPIAWLKQTAEQMAEIAADRCDAYAEIASMLSQSRITLLTGRGYLIGLGQQAALDFQEGMRIGAIATPGGLLRHGPMELICRDDGMIILLIPDDHMANTMLKLADDLVGHGARVAAFASKDIAVPTIIPTVYLPAAAAELNPILFAVAFQNLNVALGEALQLSEIRPTLIPKVTMVE